MKTTPTACLALLLALAGLSAQAIEASAVAANKHTTPGLYLTAAEAYELKQKLGAGAYFVDVRTREEIAILGMPAVADAHVPFALHPDGLPWDDQAGRFRMVPNADFAPEMARRLAASGLGKDATVILMCRSGDRSARATNQLASLGYTRVYTVVDGFEGDVAKEGPRAGQRAVNGWKNANLPISYRLDKDKLYFLSR